MDLEVSEDEESEVDHDTEPDEGDTVEPLEPGNVVGILKESDEVEPGEEERHQAA